MKLLRKLGTRLNKNDIKISYGEFLCEFDKQLVERALSSGKRQKSCGCVRYKLIFESNKGSKRTQGQKLNMSASQKGKRRTEEHKQNISKSLLGEKNPFYGKKHTKEAKQKIREGNAGKKRTEEQKRKQSEIMKGKNNPMYGIRLLGELNPNWGGGISFEVYPQEFFNIRSQILERDNYICQDPNCNHLSTKLDTHHIDFNKKNNNPENLIILCVSCHIKTNYNRVYYTEFYQNIMINRIMECLL